MHTTGILLGRITLPLVAAGMLLLASLPAVKPPRRSRWASSILSPS